jgi:hypothetical protein
MSGTKFRANHGQSWLLGAMVLAACGEQPSNGDPGDDSPSQPAGEASTSDPVTAGAQATVTASELNLRTGPSTSDSIILAMPNGAVVDVLGQSGNWDNVRYNGTVGWCFAGYLSALTMPSGGNGGGGNSGGNSGPPVTSGNPAVDQAMALAASGLGFSYHWGAGCWDPSSTSYGACYGSCPNCSHSGTWGADCSGYVAKVWQVPGPSDTTECAHPYSSSTFYDQPLHWSDVPRSNVQRGDAFVHHGHIFLFDHGDAWGQLVAYEAKGCSYGIVHDTRSADSTYKVIRRHGF